MGLMTNLEAHTRSMDRGMGRRSYDPTYQLYPLVICYIVIERSHRKFVNLPIKHCDVP